MRCSLRTGSPRLPRRLYTQRAMPNEPVVVPYQCARDHEEWSALLEHVGGKYAFVRFSRDEMRVDNPSPDSQASFAQRLRDLMTQPAPLPPQPNAELVRQDRPGQIANDQVTDYGFVCPSCATTKLSLCPDCAKYFCGAGIQDSAGRFQCPWCGMTLVYRPLSQDEVSNRKSLQVDTSSARAELRYRELPPA